MQQLELDQSAFLLHGVFGPGIANEHGLTLRVIGAIPLDQGDYRPDEVSKSALDLAWHIVSTEIRFLTAIAAGEFDFSPMIRPDTVKNSADLSAWYSDKFDALLKQVMALSGEQLSKIIDFPRHVPASGGDVSEFSDESHDSPPGPAIDVPSSDGSESSVDLRRELRCSGSAKGEPARRLTKEAKSIMMFP